MIVIALVIATALGIAWFLLLGMITKDDWITAAYNKVLDNLTAIEKKRVKDELKRNKLEEYHGIMAAIMKLLKGGGSDKEIAKLETQNERIKNGQLKYVGLLDMPGYVLLRKLAKINTSGLHKKTYSRCLELYGKKHAEKKAQQLLAKLLSYPIIGTAMSLFIGALITGVDDSGLGIIILFAGTAIVLTFVYSVFDSVRTQINKRRDAMSRQIPSVVSKLALLVTSGMIMDRAWKETANSQNLVLYMEMQKTSEELDNLVSPEMAYGNFINRCNTKETAKLASAIIQNLSKGNAEIGLLLKDMAKEAWQERRHIAKRDAEKANSKLIIPIMLLFVSVLIMIMVPVAMNFGGL